MRKYSSLCLKVVTLCAIIPLSCCQRPSFFAKTAQELTNLLKVDVPAKGNIFPNVVGPELEDHVCIVGAGPAGLHMALSLKDKGYTDVTIFEKTDRVGGKVKDLQIDGYYRPL